MIDTMPAPDADLLRAYLSERDVACPGCGYNLRGLHNDRCPECNEDVRLQVGLAEPKLASYLTGLIGLATGTGFFGIVLLWIVVRLVTHRGGPSSGETLLIAVSAAIESGALVAWLRARPRLRRLTRRNRVQLAAGCWMLTTVLAVVFFGSVR